MCLAIPGLVLSVADGEAVVDYGGVKKRAGVRLKPETKPGDRVLVHAGFVIQVLTDEDGAELERLCDELFR